MGGKIFDYLISVLLGTFGAISYFIVTLLNLDKFCKARGQGKKLVVREDPKLSSPDSVCVSAAGKGGVGEKLYQEYNWHV